MVGKEMIVEGPVYVINVQIRETNISLLPICDTINSVSRQRYICPRVIFLRSASEYRWSCLSGG